ncbi:MAG: apolipoprotein N-acyltransferase [Deltaproteobacteria bacterium]|nr:MAG: apolipoprotein N-acyltransferase [Deltaproteobacteria bacterium]
MTSQDKGSQAEAPQSDSKPNKDAQSHNATQKQREPGLFRGYGSYKLLALRFGAVALTSISQPLLSAPFNWWPWHWFAWVPFLWAITAQGGRGRWLLGLFGGTFSNLMIFYWVVNLMPNFSNIPFYVAVILTTLLCMYLSLLWVLLAQWIPRIIEKFPNGWVLLAPCLLVMLEYLMPQLFPYMQGVSHYQVIPFVQLSSITGIYGVSFLVFWSNTILFQWLRHRRQERPGPKRQAIAIAIVAVLTVSYGFWRQSLYKSKLPAAKRLKVGLIQSNYTPHDHRKTGFTEVYTTYLELSKQAAKQGADWIVWSEGEFKRPLSSKAAKNLLSFAYKQVKRPILLGGYDFKRRKDGRYVMFNSAIHVDRSGKMGPRYDKQILVPFGEYMPFEKELNFIYKKISWFSRFSRGKSIGVFELDKISYGFLICYEAIYPKRVRRSVNAGADVLVNITYDAWFGKTTAPYQHLMLAATRSAEYGIPLIRLATTGSSTVVNALGKTDKLSPIFQRKVLMYEVPLVRLPSFYAKVGDLFALICLSFALFALLTPAPPLESKTA